METIDSIEKSELKKKEETKLQVDLIVQSALLGVCLISIAGGDFQLWFFSFYFIMGGYQLISSFVHLMFKNHSKGRIFYWPQLVIHLFSFLSLLIVNDPIDIAVFILFSTGVTALYYYFLTLIEYVRIKK